MNTTFEKEDTEEEQRELKPLLSSSFTKQVEDGASDVQNAAECLKVKEEETDDKFHTPQESKRESLLDFADLQEGNFDQLLETIAALLQEVCQFEITYLFRKKFWFNKHHCVNIACLSGSQN